MNNAVFKIEYNMSGGFNDYEVGSESYYKEIEKYKLYISDDIIDKINSGYMVKIFFVNNNLNYGKKIFCLIISILIYVLICKIIKMVISIKILKIIMVSISMLFNFYVGVKYSYKQVFFIYLMCFISFLKIFIILYVKMSFFTGIKRNSSLLCYLFKEYYNNDKLKFSRFNIKLFVYFYNKMNANVYDRIKVLL